MTALPRPLVRLVAKANRLENSFFNTGIAPWREEGAGDGKTVVRVAVNTDSDDSLDAARRFGARGGGTAVEIRDDIAGTSHELFSEPIGVDPTKSYYVSLQARRVSGASTESYVKVMAVNAGGSVQRNVKFVLNAVNVGTDWTEYTAVVTPDDWEPDENLIRLSLVGSWSTVARVQFTDVVFMPQDEATTLTQGGINGLHELLSIDADVWGISHYANKVVRLNRQRKRTLELDVPGMNYPHSMAADSTYVWVVSGLVPKLHRIRRSNQQITTYDIPGDATDTLDVYRYGALWMTRGKDGATPGVNSRLVRFDPATEEFTEHDIGLYLVGGQCQITNGDAALWVGSEDGKLIKVNPADGQVILTADVPLAPYGVACDDTYVYAAGFTNVIPTDPVEAQRYVVCKVRATDGVLVNATTIPWGIESKLKYDGTRYIYGVGSRGVGGPSETAIVRWDTASGTIDTFPFDEIYRRKTVEVVGDELWVGSYYQPEIDVFSR